MTFRCDRLHVVLSEEACAARHRSAVRPRGGISCITCSQCPDGARRAGLAPPVVKKGSTRQRYQHIDWDEIDWTQADVEAIARRVGCSVSTVYRHRAEVIGAASRGGNRIADAVPWDDMPLGILPDVDMAQLLARSPAVVARHRRRIGWHVDVCEAYREAVERCASSPARVDDDAADLLADGLRRLVHGYRYVHGAHPDEKIFLALARRASLDPSEAALTALAQATDTLRSGLLADEHSHSAVLMSA